MRTRLQSLYAGEVTARETFERVTAETDAVIVDCRTREEWEWIGVPDLEDRILFIEWITAPYGDLNPTFIQEVEAAIDTSNPVYFLCRSGQRSRDAAIAATAAGFELAYNVSDGFEGPASATGQRNLAGWKVEGLPWK